jgi:fibronectin type III domain protein
MTFSLGRLTHTARLLVCALTVALGACGDDSSSSDKPNPPAGVTATALSETSVRVTWTAVSGATSYLVERAPGTGGSFAQVGTPTDATFDDTGLTGSTAYRYRVSVVTSTGTSDPSSEASVTTSGAATEVISADITADRTLFADTVYTLSGFIHVANGATLTIQPGTTILGDFNTVGSSLFILRGAKIQAVGTAAQPIVFTSSQPAGQRQPGDWGGLIIIGNGIINRSSPVILEGSNTGASNPPEDYSGGNDNADDSGELRYVRVEFAGFAPAQDQELNAFTFAAVGSGTKLSYLEAESGLDDSYEFFGGQVDGQYFVSYESGDDHFDMSEGYVGRLQYLIGFQSRVLQPRAGAGNVSNDPEGIENDGCNGANCTNGQDSEPFTIPLVANFTLVGTGPGVVDATNGGIGMMLRRGTGGYYLNGVVSRWPRAAISLRDATTDARATAGDLQVNNLLMTDIATVFQPTEGSNTQFTLNLAANSLEQSAATTASLFTALPATPSTAADFDWTPAAGSAAGSGGLTTFSGAVATKAGTFVVGTGYRGAADPAGAKWWQGWTTYQAN